MEIVTVVVIEIVVVGIKVLKIVVELYHQLLQEYGNGPRDSNPMH